MAEVLAGFVCGYAAALAVTPVAALTLVRSGWPPGRAGAPGRTPTVGLAMLLHGLALLLFTALGVVLGALLAALEERAPEGGLGSPSQAFTVLVLACTAIAVLPMAIVVPRLRRPAAVAGLAAVGLFGYLMPYLAAWSPIGSG